MRTSIFRRMLWAQAAALAFLACLAVGQEFGSSYYGYSSDFDQTMLPYATALASLLSEEPDPRRMVAIARKIQDVDDTTTWPEDVRPAGYHALYQVLDSRGAMIFRTERTPDRPYTTLGPGFHIVRSGGTLTRVLVRDSSNGRVRVLVSESLPLRRQALLLATRKLPLRLLIMFAPMALFTWLITRRVLKPLRQLADSVAARPVADLGPLEPSVDLKEVRPLMGALNLQMGRVSELIESQRRFVADAAHSLRTPLAVLGAQAHALTQAPGQAQRDELGAELQEGIQRATSVVHQLLSVARLEGARPDFTVGTVDLGRLARDRVALLVPLALRQNQDLGVEGPEHLPWQADGAMIATALDNLLENALRYTPAGGTVTLRLGGGPGLAWCEVEDNGPGIPPEFRAKAFDRFARAPGATRPGAGLGLAIVLRAVAFHGGTVRLLEPASGPGLRARIELPASGS